MQAPSQAVFITGASGFIGRHIASTLLRQGRVVRAMVRPGVENDNRIPAACEQVPVGLTDVEKLAAAVAHCAAVVYCAGSVRGRDPGDFELANILGVSAMREAIKRSGRATSLLLLSSLAASRPELSPYAHSKHAGEQPLLQDGTLKWTILRPPAVYGPGDKEMLPILKLARRGLLLHAGPRDQRLSLLHVEDLARAVAAWLADPEKCLHGTYAIDDGKPGGYDWREIGAAVSGRECRMFRLPRILLGAAARTNLVLSTLMGYAPMLTPGKVRELVQADWLCDNTEFVRLTGWRPQLDLRAGAEGLFGNTR